MRRYTVVLLHLGFWFSILSTILITIFLFYRNNMDPEGFDQTVKTIIWVVVIPSLLSFYIFYLHIFPKYLKIRKFGLSVLYGLLTALITALIGIKGVISFVESSETKFSDLPVFMFITIFSGFTGLVVKGFITWFDDIKVKEELIQKNHEMELALVKSQLDPHFLFNTINNIDGLILKDPELASEYLNRLSDIMRFMLYETKADKVSLSKEIEYIIKYVELQGIRSSNPDYIDFRVEGRVENKTIAPMLFIPFIENAFKHTNNKKVENAISISIIISDKEINFQCINKYNSDYKRQGESGGIGNDLIQKRLNLIYPEHKLAISKNEGLYSIQLTITHG